MPWPRLPARCEVCHAWPAEAICADCARDHGDAGQGIAARCARCALPLSASMPADAQGRRICGACRLRPPPLDGCACALPYAFPWDTLIARLKFGSEPGLAGPLAALMRTRPALADLVAHSELLVPLPLAPGRLAERGYNQALLLARALEPWAWRWPGSLRRSHEAHGSPAGMRPATLRRRLAPRLLRRVRETASQASLDRAARARNLRAAFAVDAAQAATIRGLRLLLVDDVMTSGATLHEAARALRAAGAASVSAVVLARTDLP